jgi:hypothetical protein
LLPWYDFSEMHFFLVHIGYTSPGYVQILWTPTYHITVPAARRRVRGNHLKLKVETNYQLSIAIQMCPRRP